MILTPHDSTLLAIAGAAIVGLALLVAVAGFHPLVALIVASLVLGLGAGVPPEATAAAFQKGFGETLGSVGAVLGLGAVLGRLMAESGAADRIVAAATRHTPPRAVPWAMAGAAFVVGVPTFFEVGVVLLLPMILAASRRAGGSVLRVAIPALAALSVLHGLLPPHPAPLLCAAAFHADLGATMALGLLVALPTAAIAGPLFGLWIARRIAPHPPDALATGTHSDSSGARGSAAVAWASIALPVGLMAARSVATLTGAQGQAALVAKFVGHPLVAMLVSVVVAGSAFAGGRGAGGRAVTELVGESLASIGGVVMIIGAGGGFKQTLVESGVGATIAKAAQAASLSPLVLAWTVSAMIRLATGSATVATVTASGILAPVLPALDHTSPALLTLAVGAGSVFFSHVNDAGFWLVKECFGMTVGETLRSWSLMETLVSVVALAGVLVAARVF